MSENQEQINQARQEALDALNEDLSAQQEASPETSRSENLLNIALEKLDYRALFTPSEESGCFAASRIGNASAFVDALNVKLESLADDNAAKTASVDLFIVDSTVRLKAEPLEQMKLDALYSSAYRFSKALSSGMLNAVPDAHPAKQTVSAIADAQQRYGISSWRIWIITSAFWNAPGKKTILSQNSDFIVEILDLDFFRSEEDFGITQKFAEPGLPCIARHAGEASQQDYDCYLTVIRGDILAKLYHKHGTSIIQENVRAYLGNNKVNKQVKETIKNAPARFLAYNNGLVVSAGKVVMSAKNPGRIVSIEGMQIINGGQTTVNIYQSLYNTTRANMPAAEQRLKLLNVPMKIVVPAPTLSDTESKNLRGLISQAANSQTAVKASDLAAKEPFQIDLMKLIETIKTPDGDYWFYERARGLYKNELSLRKYSEKKNWEAEHPDSKVFDKTDLSSAWLAWNGHPRECACGKEVAFQRFCDLCIDEETGTLKDGVLDSVFAKTIICQHFVMKELEKSLKSKTTPKELRIANPRVPTIYAIDMFQRNFGKYVRWDQIWTKQRTPDGILYLLQQIAHRVNEIMRQTMGSKMISMWGRTSQCGEELRKRFSFSGIDIHSPLWGMDLPRNEYQRLD